MEDLIPPSVRRYVVLVHKDTRYTVVSCSICEATRERGSQVAAFNFELAKAAIGWTRQCFTRRSLIPNPTYPSCSHIDFDCFMEINYPRVRGWLSGNADLPALK